MFHRFHRQHREQNSPLNKLYLNSNSLIFIHVELNKASTHTKVQHGPNYVKTLRIKPLKGTHADLKIISYFTAVIISFVQYSVMLAARLTLTFKIYLGYSGKNKPQTKRHIPQPRCTVMCLIKRAMSLLGSLILLWSANQGCST